MTPSTSAGRAYLYLAFTGGLWSAQWLLFWATNDATPKPSLFGLVMLAVISVFWFFLPPKPWFPGRRNRHKN
ncbi:hypothetical protein GCM10023063_04150 [Arthrobacter methylotrophus]|uniref:hypothetical protein n=1 Tax=Arthrobacter methylotrophus TaxID=121291 RepID=UPI0031EBDA6F